MNTAPVSPVAVKVALAPRIQAKLDTLNSLRAANGKTPLVTWKNAEALLDQRIQEETPTTVTYTPPQGPDAAEIAKVMDDAVASSTVEVTKLPTTGALATAQKRTAVIKQIAKKSVEDDVPTTVIDAKAAARQLRNADKKAKKATTKAPAAKAPKTKAPTKSTNEFGALLKELGLDPKKARQKLRSNDMSAPYTDLKAIRAILTTDGRKKGK